MVYGAAQDEFLHTEQQNVVIVHGSPGRSHGEEW